MLTKKWHWMLLLEYAILNLNSMEDGLYQITTSYLCAGFVIENGELIACAPILKKNFKSFKHIAIKVNEDKSPIKNT